MTQLLVEASVGARLLQAFRSPAAFDAEQRERFETRMAAPGRRATSSVSGDVAQINVHGLLVTQPDFLAFLIGIQQTSYSDIQNALASAASDPSIASVVVDVDSPGGMVPGLFETLQALDAFGKPLSVVASCACSAAYAIASAAGPIQARTPASEFGSVGVVRTYEVDGPTAESLSISVTSTEAPNKRPDVTTQAGRGVVREYLDALHSLFVESVARGRKTTEAKVNAEFGRGGIVLATDAKRRGMIDSIAPAPRKPGTDQALANGSASGNRRLVDTVAAGRTGGDFGDRVAEAYARNFPALVRNGVGKKP